MINSSYAAGDFLSRFPTMVPNRPETTEGRVGFIHPYSSNFTEETSTIKILLRNFDIAGLAGQEKAIRRVMAATQKKYPNVKIEYGSVLDYLNMKEVLKNYPQLTDYAIEAAKRAGVTADLRPIRGGTDGSRLTAMVCRRRTYLRAGTIFTGNSNLILGRDWRVDRNACESGTDLGGEEIVRQKWCSISVS